MSEKRTIYQRLDGTVFAGETGKHPEASAMAVCLYQEDAQAIEAAFKKAAEYDELIAYLRKRVRPADNIIGEGK